MQQIKARTKENKKMKIAILSDIHGNLPAFNAVLKDVKKQGISKFIIAGDHTGGCPQHNEVLEKIKTLDAYVIKGNRDKHILNYHKGLKEEWINHKQMSSVLWTYNTMDKSNIEYIDELPEQLSVFLPKLDSIRVVHGSPFSISEELFQDRYIERLERALNSIEESILVCGHTHEPWSKEIYNKLVVNPGSVGVHFNKDKVAEYAALTWANNKWEVSHQQVQYDFKKLEQIFFESGLLKEARIWGILTLQSMEEGKDVTKDFLKLAYKLAEDNGVRDVKLIHNFIWEKAEKCWIEKYMKKYRMFI